MVASPAIPPRELNVWKFIEARAPELGSLHAIVSDRLNNDFRSRRNKRRRTAGHDDRCRKRGFRKKRKVAGENLENGHSSGEKGEKPVSRRIRRRIELKKNPESGFVNSGDGTKRLRTHVWYAKRFTMSKLWGFHLPLGLHGKGRGSRALLKKLKKSVLLHDASYHGCAQLVGPQDMLLLLMNSILVPSPSPSPECLSGAVFGTAMLHDIGKSNRPPIAPVTFMWRPLEEDIEGVLRSAWIWVHASAFEESFRALRSASERTRDESRSVSCVSLEGRFGKLELMGLKAIPLLQKILVPANRRCSNDEATIFEGGCRIIPLIVNDPRLVIKKDDEVLPDEDCKRVDKFEYTDLWEIGKGLYPPMEEGVLSMERHHKRKKFFCIGRKSSQPKIDGFSDDKKHSLFCPVSVSIDGRHEDSVSRCSVVLPLSWVKAFWNTLISCGAHAIGLREKHWVSSELGLPMFPWDFPDCPAYSRFMEMEAAASSQKTSRIPPSRRPPEVPVPPPWNCLRRDDDDGGPFEITVARTSALFPKRREEEDDRKNEEETEPRYLRVALRAYREGAFEEGAVVCAPGVSDIALSEGGEGLQLPRSALSSYFTKVGSGEWRIQVPDGRRPIGFVTSGFVRGSKKARAVALCEAGFLSKLRREQLGEGSPERSRRREEDTFVLVRNLRSTAYRLAVATVVLEDKEDDLDFM